METKMKKIKVHLERVFILSIRTIVRFIQYHPFVVSLAFFLLVLYKSFPSLFAFLVSSSPVIACTFLLLGFLLSHGEPNIPVVEEENKRLSDVSSVDIGNFSSYLYAKENENFSIENHVDYENNDDEKPIADVEIYQAMNEPEGNKNLNTIMTKISSGEEVKKESYIVENEANQLIQEKELQGQMSCKDKILLSEELGAAEMGTKVNEQETENFTLEIGEPALGRQFDSSLGLPWLSVEDHHASSDTESDGAESSSPDASMTDIIPLLDELHPLLNSEHPEHVSITKSDTTSEGSSVDHESDDNSIGEKDVQEKNEVQEEKVDDDATAAVRWTEDDQMNVMDLGFSELERNQRLESLIAKRRARKNLTFRMDRNLIDLDANDSFLSKDELSRFRIQLPSRRNPFDIPNDSEETIDLPPIPGSAPSTLLPRQNPFDFLYDAQEQENNLMGETRNLQDLMPASCLESLFRRDGTFDLGRRGLQRERHQSRFKPYFISEMDLEGTSTFQRQFSDKSESKVSFVSESDTVSSATDQEYKKEREMQEVDRVVELSSLAKHDTDAGDHVIHAFEEESDGAYERKREHLTNYIEIDVDANHIDIENDQVVEVFSAINKDIREELRQTLPISDSEKVEVIEKKHDEPSSSSLTQQSSTLEQANNVFPESDYLTMVDQVYDNIVAMPVYDSSPSASGNSLDKQSTIDETLHYSGQGGNVDSLVKFDMMKDSIEVSAPEALQVSAASGTMDFLTVNANMEELESIGIEPLESFLISVSIDENSSRLNEVDGTNEYNAAKIGKSASQEVPDQDENLINLELFESSKYMDSLIVSEKISEFSTQSINDLLKSSDAIEVSILTKHEAGALKTVSRSGEESNVAQPSSLETDKTFLAETDGSVNSHIEELLSNLHGSDLIFEKDGQSEYVASGSRSSLNHPFNSKESSSQIVAVLGNQSFEERSIKSQELHSEVSQAGTVESQIWSPFGSKDNIEQTVYNPKIRILDLSLVEEFSEYSQPPEEGMESHVSEWSFDILSSDLQSSEVSTENYMSQTMTDLEIPVIEARSVEEIYSYFKKNSEESAEKPMYKIMTDSELPVVEARLPIEKSHSYFEQISDESNKKSLHQTIIDSQLPVVEATSIEEIHSYFKETTKEGPSIAIYYEDGSQGLPSNVHIDAKPIQSDLHVVEANSIEDIDMAFSQPLHSTSNKAPGITEESPSVPISYEVEPRDSPNHVHMDAETMQSDLHVIEANSIEDIDVAFSQLLHSISNKAPRITEESPSVPISYEGEPRDSPNNVHMDAKTMQSDLHVIEANSIEDIDVAFSQLLYGTTSNKASKITEESPNLPIYHESRDPPDNVHKDAKTMQSDLHIIEANSIEDIDVAFSQLLYSATSNKASKITAESPNLPIYYESSRDPPDNVHMDAKMIQSDMHVIEANSIEDIDVAFCQLLYSTSNIAPKISEESPSVPLYYGESRESPDNVYMDDLHVIEANSIEDIELAFSQLLYSTNNKASEITQESPRMSMHYESQDNVLMDAKPIQSDLHVIEANSIEDIDVAFNQLLHSTSNKALKVSEEGPSVPIYFKQSQGSHDNVQTDAKPIQSDLHVVEANSIEDIDVAFGQLLHSTSNKVQEVHTADDIILNLK
ncbi:uncharacterized protein LOC121992332 [Zingiber officinale]|uniref:Uncharacterized protein n=1 Tax=Zingiber officinale TaxID=94328 RepID=A0A8J5FW60_ZINOF|nr:uncharacterized protein LOC121992332 [Zingiber officinale]KAG6495411.1 hypothetical protein ZIOFF_043229 [Zingiber officinale]